MTKEKHENHGKQEGETQVNLCAQEEALIERLGFERTLLEKIRAHSIPELQQLTVHGIGEDHFPIEVPADGVTFEAPRLQARGLLRRFRLKFLRSGYLIFLTEQDTEANSAKVGIIQGSDPYDILRVMKTCDVNGDKTNEDVIAKLQEWERRYPFTLFGAGYDWVEAQFKKTLSDMERFADDLNAFAPDVYGQGEWGDMKDFIKAMRRARGFYLWWD